MSNDKYILVDGKPVREPDLIKWAKWFETSREERIVLKNKILKGTVEVSTVFLGLDHSFGRGRPLIYETMIFGGKYDDYQDRYSTKEEAVAGHAQAMKLALSGWSKPARLMVWMFIWTGIYLIIRITTEILLPGQYLWHIASTMASWILAWFVCSKVDNYLS
jgi:hypothetical protein